MGSESFKLYLTGVLFWLAGGPPREVRILALGAPGYRGRG